MGGSLKKKVWVCLCWRKIKVSWCGAVVLWCVCVCVCVCLWVCSSKLAVTVNVKSMMMCWVYEGRAPLPEIMHPSQPS